MKMTIFEKQLLKLKDELAELEMQWDKADMNNPHGQHKIMLKIIEIRGSIASIKDLLKIIKE